MFLSIRKYLLYYNIFSSTYIAWICSSSISWFVANTTNSTRLCNWPVFFVNKTVMKIFAKKKCCLKLLQESEVNKCF